MNKKNLVKYIIPAVIVAVLRFLLAFPLDAASDVIVGPLAGIFFGVPGIIGCIVGGFAFNLVEGETLGLTLLYAIPSLATTLIPFFERHFLKEKGSLKNTWIYFAISALASVVAAFMWLGIYVVTGIAAVYTELITAYVIVFVCLSVTFGYPFYFIIASIKEHSFRTGNPLLNAFICWLPLQYIGVVLLAAKVYDISSGFDLIGVVTDWYLVNVYMLILEVLVLILVTLTGSFKKVMLFIFAGLMVFASIFNIIRFDTGEGVYILVFLALWLLLHAFFYQWYENKALKVKAVKIITVVLHCVLILVLVLICALDAATYIIPRADGSEANVIVLGAPVVDNKASDILDERIEVASEFLKKDEDATAILTGGTKVEGGKTEAEVIRDGLVAAGISEDRLILESQAKTTEENFERCLEIVKAGGGSADDKVVIATSEFHLLRSGIYARRAGFNKLTYIGSVAMLFKDWSWYLREVLSLIPVFFS